MKYLDFNLRARDFQDNHFLVEVTASPMDRMREPESVTMDENALTRSLRNLERGRISQANLIALGQELARMLLPPTVRSLLLSSLDALRTDEGLRLRLILDAPQLANLPWEFLYLSRVAGGEKGRDGFLVLDPRLSLVRHEAIPMAPSPLGTSLPVQVLVGLACPLDQEQLDLATERRILEQAFENAPQIQATYLEHLSIETLQSQSGSYSIFHFAGHGMFEDGGSIVLEDANHRTTLIAADNLALTLRALGVRMAVLGACETGRRDGVNVWNGVAPALAKVGISAILANQYPIADETALAFTRRFYTALTAGLAVDQALTAGRLAMLNAGTSDSTDFGIPVLYFRAADGILFPEASADSSLEPARAKIQVDIRQRIEQLHGNLTGVRANAIRSGNVNTSQEVIQAETSSSVIGIQAKQVTGGNLTIDQKIQTADDNSTITGLDLENLG